MQYVSILSPAFSGSTLLSILLTSQPRSIGFGDTYFNPTNSPKHLCTCGQQFLLCEPRMKIANAIRSGGVSDFSWETAAAVPIPKSWPRSKEGYWPLLSSTSIGVLRMIPSTLRRALFSRFYQENRLMLDHLRDTGAYDYYFDGSKIASRLELLRTEIPDIKLIHMVRHPGAILYHDQRFGTYNVESRLAHWTRFHRRSRKFQSILGSDSYLAVPYEKIVQEPETFLRRLASFLNMQNVQFEDAGVIDRSKVHILGNAMRENVQRIIDFSNTWREHVPEESQSQADRTFRSMGWVVEMYDDWKVN